MKITNLKGLENRKELQPNDNVEFTVKGETIKYIVQLDFLFNRGYEYGTINDVNDRIFKILDINKNKIAEKTYGYTKGHGVWPVSEGKDFSALTRLVKELYLIIEKKEIVFTKFTRFEIMDI